MEEKEWRELFTEEFKEKQEDKGDKDDRPVDDN